MITTIFILAVLNLCLGFVLAAYAERISARLVALLATNSVATLPVQPAPLTEPEAEVEADAPIEPVVKLEPFGPEAVPGAWRQLLDDNRIKSQSALESLLWTLKLEISILRGILIHLEDQLRNSDTLDDEGSSQRSVAKVLDNWLLKHQEWTTLLGEFVTELARIQERSTHEAAESSLQGLLQDHQFDANQTATSLKSLNDPHGHDAPAAACNPGLLRRQLSEQIDEFHVLRDRVDDVLATFLRESGRLDELDTVLQIEGASEIYNRLGFESLFRQWRNSDPNNEQPACCLLVDIDRFSQKNDRFGNAVGDIVIAAFGGLLKSLIRNERGFDRVARFNGHSYVLFLGSTTFANAKIVAERTRQSTEATSFRIGEQSFDVTTSLGLVAIDPAVDRKTFYQSLQAAVASAKNAGRNRTCALRGEQSEIVAAASMQVKGRVIEIAVRG